MPYNVELMLPIVFSASSLHSLELADIPSTISTYTLNLLSANSNFKDLKMLLFELNFFEQLAAALHNNTSLTLLGVELSILKPVDCVPIFIKLIQSNHTLQELEFFASGFVVVNKRRFDEGDIDAMVQLVEVAANSTSLKKLSCDDIVYEQLLPHVPKQYRYIVHMKY